MRTRRVHQLLALLAATVVGIAVGVGLLAPGGAPGLIATTLGLGTALAVLLDDAAMRRPPSPEPHRDQGAITVDLERRS